MGVTPADYQDSALEVRLYLMSSDDETVKAPGTLALRMTFEGEELCTWDPTPVVESDFDSEAAQVILPGACDAPRRPGHHVDYALEARYTLAGGGTLESEGDALYDVAEGGTSPDSASTGSGDEAAEGTGQLVASPHPVALVAAEGARIEADPDVPGAVVVRGGPCEVHVTEATENGRPVTGARTRELLAGIGAEFTKSEVSDEGWALDFQEDGKFSVHYGLVADGHSFVCRGDFDTAEQQTCAAALCATMRSTGGEAAAAPSGDFVARCTYRSMCTQVREDARALLDPTCEMVGRPIQTGVCPATLDGATRIAGCETRGLAYIYYAGGSNSAERAREQCDEMGGTFTR